jgi:hypothetical protein
MKCIKAVVLTYYMYLVAMYTYFVWFKLDLSRMDLSGHIASAAQFARSGMHSFNDRMFLGTTHDLFYPPFATGKLIFCAWEAQIGKSVTRFKYFNNVVCKTQKGQGFQLLFDSKNCIIDFCAGRS